MRIIDLYGMSEEERKKALKEQQELYNERMRQSDEIRRQANQQFDDLVSSKGEYDTTRHTTTIGNLRNAYKNSSNYNKLNDSLNRIYLNSENSIWNKMQNIMTFNKTNNQRNNNIDIKNNGIDNWTTANNMAKQNNDKVNMIATTQTAKSLYEEKQKEAIKNTVEYNLIKSKNPNMSEEELIEKTKLETENKNKQFNQAFSNMSKEDRRKEIFKTQNMLSNKEGLYETEEKKNENRKIINNLLQKSEAIEAEKQAEKVNKTLNEGNFLERATTATGELAGSMGKSAIDMTLSPIVAVGSLAEGVLPTKNFKGTKFDDIVDYKKIKDRAETVKNANIENEVLKTGKGVSSTIGGMIPSIVANIVVPGSNIGMIAQASGVAGEDYIENLNEDKSNKLQSAFSGTLKGLGSYATEKITGGNILGKGSLDDWATRTIANKTSSKIAQKIASKVYEVGGENFEELLENQIDHLVDSTVNNKGVSFKDWLDEQSETVKQTTLTQLFLNLMGVGGSTYNEVQEYSQNAEMKQWINEAQKIIDKENLNIDNYKINNNNINEVRKTLNELPIKNTAETKQESTQNKQTLPTQQITQEQNNTAQNGNMEQIDNRRIATEEINNSRISTQEKQQMIEALNNIEEVSSEDINAIRNVINEANKINQLPTNLNYKDNGEARQKYMKYKNDSSNYDATAVDEVLDSIPTNRNGRRTVKQWLQVANEIGTKIANKSDAEIEKIAYRSWFDEQPTKNITRYDNQAKTNVGFQKLTSDEWLNTINNAVNEARTNNQEQSNNVENGNINKQKQLEIIQNNNPMTDDYHTGIRTLDDIKTFDEVINDDESFVWGDFSREDAKKALQDGKITVYSSHPIEQGGFVTTSQNMAKDYAGNGKIYSQEVDLNDVAWINGDEGQYAKVKTLANNQETLYNNIKTGETKNINTNQILDIISEGGYRTEEQINDLREDIKKNGITTPIEIYRKNDGTFAIENGNHRLKIAQELGIKDIPVKMVESWENIGINRDIEPNIKKEVDIDYDGSNGISETINNVNETSGDREGLLRNDNKQLEDQGTTERNVNFPTRESNSDEQTSSTGSKENNRNLKDSNQSSFNLPQKEKVNLPTKGETINWNEVDKPEGKIRKHYRSIIESSNTTAEAKAIAKEMMGTDTYRPDSNKKQLERANIKIENSNPDSELDSLMSRAKLGGKIDATDIAVGERLIQYYSKIGDKVKLRDSIQATAMAGTTAGQTVQAMALLNHQTPEGQAVWIQRSVEKLNNKMKNKKGDKAQQFDFTPEMEEKILNSKNKAELEKNLNEVYKELGQQVHKSFGQQVDSWRYFAMLGNPRTHIRNIVGNFLMGRAQGVKNKVAGAIEGTVAKFNPEMERTHTIVPASKEVLEFAKNDIENVASELELNDNKYHPQSRIESNMRTFKSSAMENTLGKMFNINDKALEAEDGWGLKAGYKKALAEYMTANKLTPENITDTQLAKGRKYAIQQAKEATFHQANAVASAVNSFINKNKGTKAVGDALVPFVKTPANVAKAGVEYSPVGLTKSLIYDSIQLRKGNITVNQYIDNISKGLTGSAITVLGFALAQAGVLKASGSDDDKKEKFDQQSGKQAYSVKIGDNTYTIDWLAPVGIPLMVGAEIYEGLSQKSKEKNSKSTNDNEITKQFLDRAEVLANSLSSTLDPMVEMSMISGLTSTIKSFAQNDTEALANMMTNGAKSYLNQFVPTLLGQVAKTTDTVERDTTSTATGTVSKAIDNTVNQIKSKIPGLRQTLPTRKDIWGNDVKLADNWPQRFFEAGILPASKKQISNDQVVKSLNDLYDKNGNSSILPTTINKRLKIDGQDYVMTNSEYNKYKTDYGKTSYNLIKELINSSDYKNLTDEQKQKAIENVYEYAKESNKLDYAKNNKLEEKESTLYKTMNELKSEGGKQSSYLNYMASTTGIEKEKDKNKILANANYDDKTKSIIYANGTGKDDKLYNNIKNSNININQYLTYKIEESEDKFLADKDSNGKSISGTAKEKVYNYVNNNITGYNNRLLLLGQKYKLSKSEQENLAKYIYQISTNSEEKNSLFEYYSKNFTIKNGKVYYK